MTVDMFVYIHPAPRIVKSNPDTPNVKINADFSTYIPTPESVKAVIDKTFHIHSYMGSYNRRHFLCVTVEKFHRQTQFERHIDIVQTPLK